MKSNYKSYLLIDIFGISRWVKSKSLRDKTWHIRFSSCFCIPKKKEIALFQKSKRINWYMKNSFDELFLNTNEMNWNY